MSKVAIVTDSNSGITQEQGKALGIYIVSMPFMINGETYYEGITLSREGFYTKLEDNNDIATSQPSPEAVMSLWTKLLESHDEVLHIPMSSALSGSYQTAVMLAQEYEDKVHVVNNQRISVTQRQSALDAKAMAETGMSAQEIKEMLEKTKMDSSIYIMVDTLKYLKKGGRITPAAAALGTILKLKPVLQIQGGKLDAFAKARTVGQAKSMMIQAVKKDIETRFGGINEGETMHLQIAHTENEEAAKELEKELLAQLPGHKVHIDHLSLSVAAHIGPGALAVACTKKLNLT